MCTRSCVLDVIIHLAALSREPLHLIGKLHNLISN